MSNLSRGTLNEVADLYSAIQSQKTDVQNLSESVEVISEEALDGAALIIMSTIAQHLIENKLAENFEDCFKIFEHMSDEWLEQILEEKLDTTCDLLEQELKEGLVLLEGDRDMGLGLVSGLSAGLGLLKKGWDLGAKAVGQGRRAAGFVKRTVAKDLRKNYQIPAGQSVAKELSKRAVANTSRIATGAVRRAGDALAGGARGLRGAWDYTGERIGDVAKLARFTTGVGAKPRTPHGIRGKLQTIAAIPAVASGIDMVTTGGYKGSRTQQIVDYARSAIGNRLQQPQTQTPQTSPEDEKKKGKKNDWLEKLSGNN